MISGFLCEKYIVWKVGLVMGEILKVMGLVWKKNMSCSVNNYFYNLWSTGNELAWSFERFGVQAGL